MSTSVAKMKKAKEPGVLSTDEVLSHELQSNVTETGLWVSPVKDEVKNVVKEYKGGAFITTFPTMFVGSASVLFTPVSLISGDTVFSSICLAGLGLTGAAVGVIRVHMKRMRRKWKNIRAVEADSFISWAKERYNIEPESGLKDIMVNSSHLNWFEDVYGRNFVVRHNDQGETYLVEREPKKIPVDFAGEPVEKVKALPTSIVDFTSSAEESVLPESLVVVWSEIESMVVKLNKHDLDVEQAHEVQLLVQEGRTAVRRFEALYELDETVTPGPTVQVLQSILTALEAVKAGVIQRLQSEVVAQDGFVSSRVKEGYRV
jgi:hypothetical protein